MSISQCKSFCKTHFREMCTNKIGRLFMKKVARYCQECSVWFWKKFLKSIYCPCCHKKLREELKNLIKRKQYALSEEAAEKKRAYLKNYNKTYRKVHREELNAYARVWYHTHTKLTNNVRSG